MRPLLLAFVLACTACGGTHDKPAAAAPKPTASGGVCRNRCMEANATCEEACLDADAPPGGDDEGCGAKCQKALDACTAKCG